MKLIEEDMIILDRLQGILHFSFVGDNFNVVVVIISLNSQSSVIEINASKFWGGE